jgi:alpha-amylase
MGISPWSSRVEILKIASGRHDKPNESARMKTINLLFVVHNHRPLGSFDQVFREGWKNCYGSFLTMLEKHPRFRLSLNNSGSLLEGLEENRSDFLSRLRALVARGQVELLGGGFYEPLLSFIPAKDAVGQMDLLNQYLSEKMNAQPQGFWLAEKRFPVALSCKGI